MPRTASLLAIATLCAGLAAAACSPGTVEPAGLCIKAAVVLQGRVFSSNGEPASPSDIGPLFGTVTRQRESCEDVFVTVTDSAYPPPRQPWIDGDAGGVAAGTPFYVKLGTEPGTVLIAESLTGELWEFQRDVGQ